MVATLSAKLRQLRELASSDNWHEREDAGFQLRNLLEQHFEEMIDCLPEWVADSNDRIRRAACIACMQRKARTSTDRVKRVLKLLDRLMEDESLYVRKACGPFVVGYLGYTYPLEVLPWLSKQARHQNLERRINVAKSFSQALGRRFPAEGVSILERLSNDPRARVRSAVSSSVRNIAKVDEGLKRVRASHLAAFLPTRG